MKEEARYPEFCKPLLTAHYKRQSKSKDKGKGRSSAPPERKGDSGEQAGMKRGTSSFPLSNKRGNFDFPENCDIDDGSGMP